MGNAATAWTVSYKAEGNQRSDDPCQRSVYEPAEEAKASFEPLFQLVLESDSESAGGIDFCTCLKNGICAGNTIYDNMKNYGCLLFRRNL